MRFWAIEVMNSRDRELDIFTHMYNFSVGDGGDFNVRNGNWASSVPAQL